MSSTIRSDTFGGEGGSSFDDSHVIETWGRITQLVVRHGEYIDSIGVGYANGNFINHGGTGGSETLINLLPDELISAVEGRCGDVLDQITFRSNKEVYGPFGGSGGHPFSLDFQGKTLLYLFGRSGAEVDQIAFAYGDAPPALPITIFRSGGHGGTGGSPFDDLSTNGSLLGNITSITVRHGSQVDNISVKYGNGPSVAYGGSGGQAETFNLGQDEWVTEVHGRSGEYLDQVQFFTSLGNASAIFGGNGGTAFVEKREKSVVKAFFGRSGEYVDQLGIYFDEAKPTAIEILSMTYDLNAFSMLTMPPVAVLTTFLENTTTSAQQILQSVAVQVSDTHSTSVTETQSTNVSFTVAVDFLVAKSSLTVGYTQGEQTMTETSETKTRTFTVDFSAMVSAKSKIKATCVANQSNFDVPWTARARVSYQDRPAETMTLHGTLSGVGTTSVDAEYAPA